jgi:hypothetical protein
LLRTPIKQKQQDSWHRAPADNQTGQPVSFGGF